MNPLAGTPVKFRPEKGASTRQQSALDRRARWKAMGLGVLRMLGAMALSALVLLGAFEAWDWSTRSPLFDARAVRFRGVVHASREDLQIRSGLKPGQNLFRADLAAAARGIESSEWVLSASVSRSFPPAFDLEVVEHVPAARVELGRTYLADIEARVFKRLDVSDPPAVQALPLVTGLGRQEWEEKRQGALPKLAGALQLIEAWQAESLPLDQLLEVRAAEPGAYLAFVRGEGLEKPQELRVGQGPFRPKFRRYAQVRAALVRRGEKALRIDLDNQARPEWVAAQLATDTNLASPAQRP